MASASTPVRHGNEGSLQKSRFQQTVCLADWWLVWAENDIQGRRLAVAGFASREKQAMRVFSSAPIIRRYDAFTVETTDGICVILNGFINKDRTVENGFPSDVCNYFVFGFPPYWKEYDEKFLGKESSSKDISGVTLQRGMECGETHLGSHERDFGSQGRINAKGMRKSKKTKSLALPLPQKSSSVVGGSEDNLNMSWIASKGLEKESYSRGPSGEDHTTPELLVNSLKNKMKSLPDSSSGRSINASAIFDKEADYSQIRDSREILSACRLYNGRRKRATDSLRNVESDYKNTTKANFDRDMSSSEGILRVTTRLMSSLKMKEKNNQISARISGGDSSMGPGKVESVVLDHEPGRGSNRNFEVSGLRSPTDEIQLRLSGHGFEQVPRTPNKDEGLRKIKTKSNIQKAKNEATKSVHTPAAADNQKDKMITSKKTLSEKAKAFDIATKRKLAYVSKGTSDGEEEKVPSASPQSSSFKRSRSGRLLMPTLEFWRSQRAIYDADRTITGIEGGICPEQPRHGHGSTLQRKRKQPR